MGFPTHDCRPDNSGCVFNTTRTGFLLDWLVDHGAPGFLIGLTSNMYLTNETTTEREATLGQYLSDYVPFLTKRGQLERAYLYGVDEPWGAAVKQATKTADLARRLQPSLKFLQNTNQNNTKVISELTGHFDALDINLQWFDATNATGYREIGAIPELWWNLNIWPAIHPNLYLEFPFTDARAVGPLSWLQNISGFEYWSAFTAGGKANFTPVSEGSAYVPWGVGDDTMDGTLVYPTESGEVLSSMRLESFRDGIEEMEYLYLLEESCPNSPLLQVDELWVKGMTSWSLSPSEIMSKREALADAIVSCRVKNDDESASSKISDDESESSSFTVHPWPGGNTWESPWYSVLVGPPSAQIASFVWFTANDNRQRIMPGNNIPTMNNKDTSWS